MAQFLVYRLPGGPLVIDLQSDLIDTLARVVAPLTPEEGGPRTITRLEPIFTIAGERVVLRAAELAAIPRKLLSGTPVADLRGSDYAIRGALDMLFSGF